MSTSFNWWTATIHIQTSKTFYFSSLLFPKNIREDIFILYSYVRTADNFIDNKPPQINEFLIYK